jgi:endo-1,4-beta-xylanase
MERLVTRIPENLSRRQTLGSLLALGMAGCSGGASSSGGGGSTGTIVTPAPTPVPTPTPTPSIAAANIKASAAAKNMHFGSSFAWSGPGWDAASFANPFYASLIEHDCTILVPENEMKWAIVQPANTTPDYTQFDAMMAYAESKGIAMRGTNLVWHKRDTMPPGPSAMIMAPTRWPRRPASSPSASRMSAAATAPASTAMT